MCGISEGIAAACENGVTFLSWSGAHSSGRYYFDRSGHLKGLEGTTDNITICGGYRYWPERVHCESPILTEVICGKKTSADLDFARWVRWRKECSKSGSCP